MKEPSPHKSRLVLAGGLAAAIIISGAGFFLGRSTARQETIVVTQDEAPAPTSIPLPAPPAVLGRADIIKIAADAADAMAAGHGPDNSIEQVSGKRFEITLAFGCDGPADEQSAAPMRWHYDPAAATLRLHVAPMTWSPDAWEISESEEGATAEAPGVESIEGFWIDQPWTSSANCTAITGDPDSDIIDPMPSAEESLAIGQVFESDGGTRADQRRGKPYSNVLRMAPEALDSSQGFRLRLTGRIIRLPTGGVVHCRQVGGGRQRPSCLVGAQFDEVAIENPADSKILATWRVGHR